MPGFSVTARSAASSSELFAVLIDGTTWPDWSPMDEFCTEPIPLDHVGERPVEDVVRVFRTGRSIGRELVVGLVPDRRIDYIQLPGGPLVGYRATIQVEADGGGSVIRWSGDFARATVRVLTPLNARMLPRFMQRCAFSAARYAERVESSRAPLTE